MTPLPGRGRQPGHAPPRPIAPAIALAIVAGLLLSLLPITPAASGTHVSSVPHQEELRDALARTQAHYPGDVSYFIDAASALGLDPRIWPSPQAPALDLLVPRASCQGASVLDKPECIYVWERIAYAAATAGFDPRTLTAGDAVAKIREGFVGNQFGDATLANDDMWAIHALRAAGVPADDEQLRAAGTTVRNAQQTNGGWSHATIGGQDNVDLTASALLALHQVGMQARDSSAARSYLTSAYDDTTGAWSFRPDQSKADCESTAWAIAGAPLVGLDAETARARDWLRAHVTTLEPDGVTYWCILQAVPALTAPAPRLPYDATLTPSWPSSARALSPATPILSGATTWRFDDPDVAESSDDRLIFPHGGRYHYAFTTATASGIQRGQGDLDVVSAQPATPTLPATLTALRHHDIELDIAATPDPDGRVVDARVEWGDGTTDRAGSTTARHAYALPGAFTLRVWAIDDAGETSATAAIINLTVQNQPPSLSVSGPTRGDRTLELTLTPVAVDPDQDGVTVTWTWGDTHGNGSFTQRFTSLGRQAIVFTAQDALGATTRLTHTLDITNLAPRIDSFHVPTDAAADSPLTLRADVSDPEGDALTLAWRLDDQPLRGPTPQIQPATGQHLVELSAQDAFGANTSMGRSLLVGAASDASAHTVPPELTKLEATWTPDGLRVSAQAHPTDSMLEVSVVRAGVKLAEQTGHSPLLLNVSPEEAAGAEVVVVAHHDGLEARRQFAVPTSPAAAASAPGVDAITFDAPPAADLGRPWRVHAGGNVTHLEAWEADALLATSTTADLVITFETPGEHVVRLRAIAADGATHNATRRVAVSTTTDAAAADAGAPATTSDSTRNATASGGAARDDAAMTSEPLQLASADDAETETQATDENDNGNHDETGAGAGADPATPARRADADARAATRDAPGLGVLGVLLGLGAAGVARAQLSLRRRR